MIPAAIVAAATSLIPAAIFVAILVIAGAIVWSIVTTAEPGGLVPRTMDPKASWQATW